ncbi:hypothetical protein AB833_15230 [Chromatiales bacterium (ex Bugula neritina AB1)]|nr:hypothetical protein AB833_15230 [Chromatiales bacterium (ex Bugula neritina AB1)]
MQTLILAGLPGAGDDLELLTPFENPNISCNINNFVIFHYFIVDRRKNYISQFELTCFCGLNAETPLKESRSECV